MLWKLISHIFLEFIREKVTKNTLTWCPFIIFFCGVWKSSTMARGWWWFFFIFSFNAFYMHTANEKIMSYSWTHTRTAHTHIIYIIDLMPYIYFIILWKDEDIYHVELYSSFHVKKNYYHIYEVDVAAYQFHITRQNGFSHFFK